MKKKAKKKGKAAAPKGGGFTSKTEYAPYATGKAPHVQGTGGKGKKD